MFIIIYHIIDYSKLMLTEMIIIMWMLREVLGKVDNYKDGNNILFYWIFKVNIPSLTKFE